MNAANLGHSFPQKPVPVHAKQNASIAISVVII